MNTTELSPHELANEAARVIAERTGVARHEIALTLGSGWGGAAQLIGDVVAEIDAAEIPGFHASSVVGHGGKITSIKLKSGHHALVLGARTHFYEGKGVRAVAHGVRTAAAGGAKVCILTNGCGSTVQQWGPGTAVLIKDHLNLTATSPIEGAHFVDLSDAYSARLRAIAHEVDPNLPEGVYTQFPGPHYETPAEVKMARIMGGDLVGMSTALETIAAAEAGVEVLGISLVTNHAAGFGPDKLDHKEVLEAGQAAGPRISRLLADIIERITTTLG
ncbi:purine-nucleoside phosphorylase [Arcanobacterium pinnipediorum]|uniref:Purine nucleoside phosphorylase n=1 Tax=Arcanobacterium pinnipediorum TaxID=1503041 RepID=A0ABY5AGC7_9ACTO|nr:purine-nucleoside phosphorylase [Arcanobacterium pinnipediorum]USR78973.1 purine-nucleoside phosphorylase [Arcanobacterium pinnipediorum]